MALLDVESVTVRYGGLLAVSDVRLAAQAGTITGLIGPNGAGKTTLFNVITGLQRPSTGRVMLNGRDITDLPTYKRARLGMARTFQRLELFGALTARQNIQVAASIRARWAEAGEPPVKTASRLISRLGLERVADVRADSLPTGQGRLVELGRALATQPRLVLLDEPAAGQDASETARFSDLLQELAGEGTAVLLVEHDMQLVMNTCEYVFVLDFGKLLAEGTPAAIRRDPAVLAAYLGREWQTV